MAYRTLYDCAVAGKPVLVRLDLNVPLLDGHISSEARILRAIPTLEYLLKAGAMPIVVSHLGRPKAGVFEASLSLAPVAESLKRHLSVPVILNADWTEQGVQATAGSITLLENIRFQAGEKENSPALAKKLAELAPIVVMDAFATAHRKEASTYGVLEAAECACMGPLMVEEITALEKALSSPAKPRIAVVGGSKISSKITILESLLERMDGMVIGGGMANTFLLAQGYSVGASLAEPEAISIAQALLSRAKITGKTILLPQDVLCAETISSEAPTTLRNLTHDTLQPAEKIVDIGPETVNSYTAFLQKAAVILINGPMGIFEIPQFAEGTLGLFQNIATMAAYTVAGGGDTLAAIESTGVSFDYHSTAGGAFLEYLEGHSLPGILALEKRA